MNELAALAIVGAAISVLVQVIKSSTNMSAPVVRVMVIGLSVVAAIVYSVLRDSGYWPAVIEITALANTVYLFLIKPLFEE